MKLLKTFLSVLIALGFSLTTYAQNDITQAFASGNISKIENFLGNQIEVSILNGSNVCDKQKAKSLLEDFFRKHHPSNYSQTLKTEKDKSGLYVGKLYTNNGVFNLFITTTKESSRHIIQQIKINKIN